MILQQKQINSLIRFWLINIHGYPFRMLSIENRSKQRRRRRRRNEIHKSSFHDKQQKLSMLNIRIIVSSLTGSIRNVLHAYRRNKWSLGWPKLEKKFQNVFNRFFNVNIDRCSSIRRNDNKSKPRQFVRTTSTLRLFCIPYAI